MGGARRIRVGVVGAGNMGAHHARAYASLPHLCELVAVHDPNSMRARAVAARTGAFVCASLDELLDRVDAVSIASPSALHVEHTVRALERGCDVLVEKPLALGVAQARLVEQAAAACGARAIVQVGHIEHFNPAVRELRKLVGDRALVALEMQRLSPWDGRIGDSDVIQDLMLHDIHVLLSLARAPLVHAAAVARSVRSASRADHAVATFAFADGLIAALCASRVTEEKVRRLAVTTDDSYVTLDYVRRTIEICRSTSLRSDRRDSRTYRQESIVERVFVPPEEPLVAQLASFLECVRERRSPEVGIAEGIRCLEVVERLQRSARAAIAAVDGEALAA